MWKSQQFSPPASTRCQGETPQRAKVAKTGLKTSLESDIGRDRGRETGSQPSGRKSASRAFRKTMSGSNIWDQVLARIETKVNRHSFYTWFKPTSFVADDGHEPARPRAERPLPRLAEQALRRRPGEALSEVHRQGCDCCSSPTTHCRRKSCRCPSRPPEPATPSPRAEAQVGARARATPSTPSSSDPRTSSRTPPAARSRKPRRARTTRCSSTAAWGSARRT